MTSYNFCTMDNLEEGGLENEKKEIASFLDNKSSEKCENCSKPAQFFYLKKSNYFEKLNENMCLNLCANHFVDHTLEIFRTRSIKIDEVTPAHSSNKAYMSGDF